MSYVSDPIKFATSVTPSDLTSIGPFRALWIGGAGDVAVQMAGNNAVVVFPALTVGWHPIQGTKVMATNTTASDIVAGW